MDEKIMLYVGAKIIQATRMTEIEFLHKEKKQPTVEGREDREGYLVIYPDGYRSWSPKETFESAYRLVTDGEKELFN